MLAYSAASGLGRVLRALRKDLLDEANPKIVFTADLATVLKTMALDGRGISWLPRSLIEQELRDRRLVEAGGPKWRIDLDIRLFRSQAAQLPAAEAFWKAVAVALTTTHSAAKVCFGSKPPSRMWPQHLAERSTLAAASARVLNPSQRALKPTFRASSPPHAPLP